MKRRLLILFTLGLALEVGGFAASNAEHIPGVLATIAPFYRQARQALAQIESQELVPTDPGFHEIIIVAGTLTSSEAIELRGGAASVRLIRQWFPDATIGNLGIPKEHHLVFELGSGRVVRLRRDELAELVASGIAQRAFYIGLSVFLVGTASQVLGFVLEWRGARKPAA
ncbi:MAG: hypothetical protein A3F90_07350 [Deltaproteobacteria bacterium RIFCSPLOWO2_12_FULL_60_19]|nr:MAG: hypothetical protein A3F90_07350 [Deltaproteobacteria bacterium RIFCSPLOWO2_12_FULL_60_19]